MSAVGQPEQALPATTRSRPAAEVSPPERPKQPPERNALTDRDYSLLLLVFVVATVLYYGANLFKIIATSHSLQEFAASLVNTPSLALGPCGAVGAAIAQVFARGDKVATGKRLVCLLFSGSVAGLCVPYVIDAGISAFGATKGKLADSQGMYMFLSLVFGFSQEKLFESLVKKVVGE